MRPGAAVVLELRDGRIAAAYPRDASVVRPRSEWEDGDVLGDASVLLVPALADAHIHLVACAAERAGVDLGQLRPRSLPELLERLAGAARSVAPGSWLRASGYDEAWLAERRHPRRRELDASVPHAPLRMRHATRHASLLNSLAFARIELHLGRLDASRAPRDADGAPLGIVFGLEPEITRAIGPLEPAAIRAGLATVSGELAQYGVASLDEMTASNDATRVALLADAVASGVVRQRVRAYVGDADEAEPARRAAAGQIDVAGVKLLARSTEEVRAPAFRDGLARARRRGLAVAVHAVEADVVSEVLAALEAAPPREPTGDATENGGPDRLEHCALCPPELVRRIAATDVAVVTQPAFLAERNVKYRSEVEPELWPWLYPIRSLRAAGVLVAGGSDAPVVALDPRLGLRGAVERGATATGADPLGAEEALDPAAALDLFTGAPGRLRGEPAGSWPEVGDRADLLVVESCGEGRFVLEHAPLRHALAGGAVIA